MAVTDAATEYRKTPDYQRFLHELLEGAGGRVAKAQAALNEAEHSRRVDAAIAVRAGFGKVATANLLGISRPTLDAWLKDVDEDVDTLQSVLDHEAFVARQVANGELGSPSA